MKRLILSILAVHCSCAATTLADDYLLRLDTIGYVNNPASDKPPKETILGSIETIARPRSAFHGKVKIGAQTLMLSGELHPADNGHFNVQLRYTHSIDRGMTVPTECGGLEPVLDASSLSTTLTIALGTPVLVGGSETETKQVGEATKASKARHVLLLTEYDATAD